MSEQWDNYYRNSLRNTDRASGLVAVAGLALVLGILMWAGGAW